MSDKAGPRQLVRIVRNRDAETTSAHAVSKKVASDRVGKDHAHRQVRQGEASEQSDRKGAARRPPPRGSEPQAKPAGTRSVRGSNKSAKDLRRRQGERPTTTPASNRSASRRDDKRQIGATSEADYEVGYGKPPKSGQYKPGQSGNPKGRSKGSKNLHTMAREIVQKSVRVQTATGSKKMTRSEVWFEKLAQKADTGDLRSIVALLKFAGTEIGAAETPEAAEQRPLSRADNQILESFAQRILSRKSKGDPQ
ncbi:MAG: hypothetical protein JJ913_14050 [Rhizobiaceae bacterium]|nr:hypothetical protein [Rhizobiaceae bacterium]